jgi:hypothetical protein
LDFEGGGVKTCRDCRAQRELSCFSQMKVNKDGLNNICRECAAIRWAAFAAKKRAERLARPRQPLPPGNWREVGRAPDYFVSDDGRVWTYRHNRVLIGSMSRDGYRKVQIKYPEGIKQVFVHRLVAEAFIRAPMPGEQVRHMDGDKLNCSASNLEWGTCKDNINDKWKHGKMVIGERHHMHKIPLAEVPKIRKSRLGNTALARIYGVTRSAIYGIRHGKSYGWLEDPDGR